MKKIGLIVIGLLLAKVLTCNAFEFKTFLAISTENQSRSNETIAETYLWRTVVTPGNIDAVQWYEKEAQAGNAEAQFGLGTLFFKGMGKPQDRYQAVQWFNAAAAQGHASAQFLLGYMYLNGIGVPEDKRIACDWFEKAAAQGDPHAQFNLATLYFSGEGIPEHFIKGLNWYTTAASQGHAFAQSMLGTVYNHGIGIAVDHIAAYVWWSMADTSTKVTTREEINELKKRMTDAEIKLAQTTSSKCFESNYQDCEAEITQAVSSL
jgi:TPR repeat protein